VRGRLLTTRQKSRNIPDHRLGLESIYRCCGWRYSSRESRSAYVKICALSTHLKQNPLRSASGAVDGGVRLEDEFGPNPIKRPNPDPVEVYTLLCLDGNNYTYISDEVLP